MSQLGKTISCFFFLGNLHNIFNTVRGIPSRGGT